MHATSSESLDRSLPRARRWQWGCSASILTSQNLAEGGGRHAHVPREEACKGAVLEAHSRGDGTYGHTLVVQERARLEEAALGDVLMRGQARGVAKRLGEVKQGH